MKSRVQGLRIKWILGLLLIVNPGLVMAAKTNLDFKDALEKALAYSPALKSAATERNIRELEHSNTFSNFFPSLDLSAMSGFRGSDPSVYERNYGNELGLSLTQNFYNNGADWVNHDSAKLRKEISSLQYKNERDQVLLAVANQFFRYSLSSGLLEVKKQQADIISQQFRSVSSQYQQGVRTRRDFLRFKTELSRTTIDLEEAKTDLQKAKIELLRLIGFEASQSVSEFNIVPLQISETEKIDVPATAPDLKNHYRYQIFELEKKINSNDVQLVRNVYRPELYLTAGAQYRTDDYSTGTFPETESDYLSWNLLLGVRFNLIDWGKRRRDISIQEGRRLQAENTLQLSLDSFEAENRKLVLDLKRASENFSMSRELLDLERQSHSFLQTEYRNGRVTYLDIILGLRDLLNSRVQVYSNYFLLKEQVLKFHYHQGTLNDELFK